MSVYQTCNDGFRVYIFHCVCIFTVLCKLFRANRNSQRKATNFFEYRKLFGARSDSVVIIPSLQKFATKVHIPLQFWEAKTIYFLWNMTARSVGRTIRDAADYFIACEFAVSEIKTQLIVARCRSNFKLKMLLASRALHGWFRCLDNRNRIWGFSVSKPFLGIWIKCGCLYLWMAVHCHRNTLTYEFWFCGEEIYLVGVYTEPFGRGNAIRMKHTHTHSFERW